MKGVDLYSQQFIPSNNFNIENNEIDKANSFSVTFKTNKLIPKNGLIKISLTKNFQILDNYECFHNASSRIVKINCELINKTQIRIKTAEEIKKNYLKISVSPIKNPQKLGKYNLSAIIETKFLNKTLEKFIFLKQFNFINRKNEKKIIHFNPIIVYVAFILFIVILMNSLYSRYNKKKLLKIFYKEKIRENEKNKKMEKEEKIEKIENEEKIDKNFKMNNIVKKSQTKRITLKDQNIKISNPFPFALMLLVCWSFLERTTFYIMIGFILNEKLLILSIFSIFTLIISQFIYFYYGYALTKVLKKDTFFILKTNQNCLNCVNFSLIFAKIFDFIVLLILQNKLEEEEFFNEFVKKLKKSFVFVVFSNFLIFIVNISYIFVILLKQELSFYAFDYLIFSIIYNLLMILCINSLNYLKFENSLDLENKQEKLQKFGDKNVEKTGNIINNNFEIRKHSTEKNSENHSENINISTNNENIQDFEEINAQVTKKNNYVDFEIKFGEMNKNCVNELETMKFN